MAYEITKSDGSTLINVQEGEVDTTFSLALLGKNFLSYGEIVAENFVHLLEHFASEVAPSNPIVGQLWYSLPLNATGRKVVKVYAGNGVWKPLGHVFVGAEPSLSFRAVGDQWWDTSIDVLKVWNGEKWIFINCFNEGTGVISHQFIVDIHGNLHPCVKVYVNNVLVSIWSSDADYIPAEQALQVAPVGIDPEAVESYDYRPFTGADQFGNDADLGEGDYNRTGTIGKGLNLNASSDFKIRGVAVEAEFADVAEVYVGDAAYEAGTLVSLGGEAEVTATSCDADKTVFGVVSARPAYLLNARDKMKKNAIPIAVAGRVQIKVKGPVVRGDRLVASDEPGVARAATENDPVWSVVGRVLKEDPREEVKKVQATVGAR